MALVFLLDLLMPFLMENGHWVSNICATPTCVNIHLGTTDLARLAGSNGLHPAVGCKHVANSVQWGWAREVCACINIWKSNFMIEVNYFIKNISWKSWNEHVWHCSLIKWYWSVDKIIHFENQNLFYPRPMALWKSSVVPDGFPKRCVQMESPLHPLTLSWVLLSKRVSKTTWTFCQMQDLRSSSASNVFLKMESYNHVQPLPHTWPQHCPKHQSHIGSC